MCGKYKGRSVEEDDVGSIREEDDGESGKNEADWGRNEGNGK